MTLSTLAASALKTGLNNVELSTLTNGMQLAWLPQANAPRLALNFFMPGGNLIDGKPGLSDLVDRLLLKGTDTRSQEQIAELLDGSSLELDIDTRRDSTILSAVMLLEDLDESLELIQDLMYHATLAD